jgi:DNA-binding MarR family transcriptional regulator
MTSHSSGKHRGRALPLGARISRIADALFEGSFTGAPPSSELVGRAIRARHLRRRYFPDMFFGEPAWDMLLELLDAELDARQVTITNLCEAVGVPGSVGIRWLNSLVAEGLVRKRPDPHNTFCEFIELEPAASTAFRRYFAELSRGDQPDAG